MIGASNQSRNGAAIYQSRYSKSRTSSFPSPDLVLGLSPPRSQAPLNDLAKRTGSKTTSKEAKTLPIRIALATVPKPRTSADELDAADGGKREQVQTGIFGPAG